MHSVSHIGILLIITASADAGQKIVGWKVKGSCGDVSALTGSMGWKAKGLCGDVSALTGSVGWKAKGSCGDVSAVTG